MEHRAKTKLTEATRQLKECFEPIYALYNKREKLPDYLFCDLYAGRKEVLSAMMKTNFFKKEYQSFENGRRHPFHLLNAAYLWALWRLSQGIYRFDPDVYKALIDTPIEGDIPLEVLQHFPDWGVYVETPGLSIYYRDFERVNLYGFWAYADELDEEQSIFFAFDVDKEDQVCLPMMNLLLPGGTLKECVEKTETAWQAVHGTGGKQLSERNEARHVEINSKLLPAMLNLLIYLCTQSDLMRRGELAIPQRAAPKKVKGGFRFFPSQSPQIWDVGTCMGSAIRSAMSREQDGENGAHTAPRPHIRRAHWHSFRVGARKLKDGTEIPAKDRDLVVKWLPPIPVNAEDFDAMPATIRMVK